MRIRGPIPVAKGEQERAEYRLALRALAVLRALLLPIVFAGDRLVAHPTVGTSQFDAVFRVGCVYAVLALIESWRRGGPRVPAGLFLLGDLLLVGALTFESGGAFSQLRAAFLGVPLAAGVMLSPRRTAMLVLATGAVYLIVAVTHPATPGTNPLHVTLAQGLYVLWFGSAAILSSGLLAIRQQRTLALAEARRRLVAQAVEAEERARKRLSDDLHDHAIQNVLTAKQDIADARAGDHDAFGRAETALHLALSQLRSTVRELHPYLLDHLDLSSALETISEDAATRGGYEVQLTVDPAAIGPHDQLVVSLVRELLANVTKHASATHVIASIRRAMDSVSVEVCDDGCGFTAEHQLDALRAGHIGIASCRERVESTGGRFAIDSLPGAGTQIRCTIPDASSDVAAARPDVASPAL